MKFTSLIYMKFIRSIFFLTYFNELIFDFFKYIFYIASCLWRLYMIFFGSTEGQAVNRQIWSQGVTHLCVWAWVCVWGVGWSVGLGCRGGWTAEQKMTVVLSVPVVWFGPGSLPHMGKTTISQHDASTFCKRDPQKKLTVLFFLVVTSIIKTIFCIFFILLEFSRSDTIQHKTFSWKFLFSYYCKSILYLFFFGKAKKFVRHCQKSFNRQTCTTGSAASGGREGINLGQAWVKM